MGHTRASAFRVYPMLLTIFKLGFHFMTRFLAHKVPMVGLLLATFLGFATPTTANGLTSEARETRERTVVLADLPPQGRQTYALILQGGPFPYDKDGSVFGNRERQLPVQARGYYREYTVRTPGVKSRGARRIACGGPPRNPEVCYYSDDHYASFRKIAR